MSSRKAATAKKNGAHGAKHRTSTRPKPAAPAVAKPTVAATETIATAEQLAADIQRALRAGDLDVLTPETLQTLMTAACRLYAAQSEAGSKVLPVGEVTPTDIMVTASGLMRAGNLAVFELGMWQSWTGR
jgi:predicted lipid-binding transport protein (Tim44 family)